MCHGVDTYEMYGVEVESVLASSILGSHGHAVVVGEDVIEGGMGSRQ